MAKTAKKQLTRFEEGMKKSARTRYALRLYVTGMTPRSARAVQNITRLCEEHLKGRYDLDVVDIFQQPDRARENQVIVAPTLVKTSPLPLKRLIGDMTDTDSVLRALNVKRK